MRVVRPLVTMTTVRTPRPASVPPAAASAAPGVLFSDVDGTLLDERGRLAVSARAAAGFAPYVDLVLTSSRTIPELLLLQQALSLHAPLVAENGAVVAVPVGWRGGRAGVQRRIAGTDLRIVALGAPAARIRGIVRRSAAHAGVPIVEQRETLPDRGRSLGRTHSVLVRNQPDSTRWRRFRETLHARGLIASRSGHWLTITRGADKGDGVRALLALAARAGAPYRIAAAVGNAENDLPLLHAVDQRFAVRNPRRGADPALVAIPDTRVLRATGIAGWPEAMRRVLRAVRNS